MAEKKHQKWDWYLFAKSDKKTQQKAKAAFEAESLGFVCGENGSVGHKSEGRPLNSDEQDCWIKAATRISALLPVVFVSLVAHYSGTDEKDDMCWGFMNGEILGDNKL